jgi:hypothetical protein
MAHDLSDKSREHGDSERQDHSFNRIASKIRSAEKLPTSWSVPDAYATELPLDLPLRTV